MFGHRLPAILLLLPMLSCLFGASLQQEPMFTDPYASEKLLEGRTFMRELRVGEAEAASQLEISLVTMGRGDPLYIWFGHSSIVVTNRESGRSVMYDYGIFGFDDDFYRTFALGRLNYEVWATSTPARIDLAIEEDRDVTEIVLDLSDSARLEILSLLNYNIQDGPNTYLYHHYRENCSTRIRDIIDRATGGQLHDWATSIPMDETIRQLVGRHTRAVPPIEWVLDFLQSGSIDTPITLWEAMFLPKVLESALLEFTNHDLDGNPVRIATEQQVHHRATEGIRDETLGTWTNDIGRISLVAGGAAFLILLLGRFQGAQYMNLWRRLVRFTHGMVNFLWCTAAGVLAILLSFMMLASSHDVTYFNENIIFVNPFLIIMAIQALRSGFGNQRALSRFRRANTVMTLITIGWMLMKLMFIDLLVQANWNIMITMLPLYLVNSTLPFERLFAPRRRIIDDSDW